MAPSVDGLPPPRIIEFVGTPGAGKSTLLPTVIAWLTARDVDALTVVDAGRAYAARTWIGRVVVPLAPRPLRRHLQWLLFIFLSWVYRVAFILRHPTLARRLQRSQARRSPLADAKPRQVTLWFWRTAGYYEFLRRHAREGEAVVFDEAFLHRVVQLFTSAAEPPDARSVAAYVAKLPAPDLVIHVVASVDRCQQRVHERGLERHRHLEGRTSEHVARFLKNAEQAVALAVAEARRRGWEVLEIDNESDEPATARRQLEEGLALSRSFSAAAAARG